METRANLLPDMRSICDGYQGHNYGLPDCLAYVWERLNESVNLTYWDFAAITGDSTAQVYNRNPSTRCEYCVSGYLAGAEHIGQVFSALGYGYAYATAAQINSDKDTHLRKVTQYIDAGLPVLVKTAMANVPGWESDVGTYCPIVGYNDGGRTLLLMGGMHRLIKYETGGEIKMDWIFAGDKLREVTLEELYLGAVKRIPYWLTLPERDGMFFGAAAFRAWADDIENERYEDEKTNLWTDYSVYVVNLATSPAIPYFMLKKLAEMNSAYSGYRQLHDKISTLFPAFKPDDMVPDESKGGLWSELEHLGGGLNVTREVLCDKEKRSKISAALRDYASRLDKAVELLERSI